MELREWGVAILLIIGAAIGTAVSSGLSETEVLKPKPEFLVDFDSNFGNTTHGEKFSLKNIGNEQAKNAILYIKASKPIKLSNVLCPESIAPNSQNIYHEIKFEKISTSIDCILEFDTSPKHNIYSIIVTAYEADGYQHNFKDKDVDILTILILMLRSFEVTLALIIISYGLVGISLLYLILKRQEHGRRVTQLTNRERELQNELQRINQDVDSVEDSISSQHLQQVPPHTLNRLRMLREKSEQLTNTLEAIRIGTSRPSLYFLIGEFFSKWIELEEQIKSFLPESFQKKTVPLSMYKMLKEISKLEILPELILGEIRSISKFRNLIIHGTEKLDKNNLESKISVITGILNDLDNVTRINQFIVRIPAGSAVPGCEEKNECFDPYELKIKQDQIVIWLNEDSAAHTVTSGTPDEGPDGKFDSSMIMSGDTFANHFAEKGTYHYFCMVHPWQVGKIIVS